MSHLNGSLLLPRGGSTGLQLVDEGSGGVTGSGDGSVVALLSVEVDRSFRYCRSSDSSSGSSGFSSACLMSPRRSRIVCVRG